MQANVRAGVWAHPGSPAGVRDWCKAMARTAFQAHIGALLAHPACMKFKLCVDGVRGSVPRSG